MFLNERNMQVHLVAVAVVSIAGIYTALSHTEWCILLLTYSSVLVAEMMNTAIERFVDAIHPERDPKIGAVKDIAAGGVMIAAIIAVGIAALIFLPKWI